LRSTNQDGSPNVGGTPRPGHGQDGKDAAVE
jgi:hypothetical protein